MTKDQYVPALFITAKLSKWHIPSVKWRVLLVTVFSRSWEITCSKDFRFGGSQEAASETIALGVNNGGWSATATATATESRFLSCLMYRRNDKPNLVLLICLRCILCHLADTTSKNTNFENNLRTSMKRTWSGHISKRLWNGWSGGQKAKSD